MDVLYPPSSQPLDQDMLRDGARHAEELGRPWVMVNFVTSINGTVTVEGRSGGLSGEGDKALFRRLRAASDVVLVGAGTARTENYRRPSTPEGLQQWRSDQRLTPAPRLVVVSRTADLPADLPLLDGDGAEPLLVHTEAAATEQLPSGVEPMACGEGDSVDLEALLGYLYRSGTRLVLCEGGPHLFGDLAQAGLVDELFVTVSPQVVEPAGHRMIVARSPLELTFRLHRLVHDGDEVLLDYRCTRR